MASPDPDAEVGRPRTPDARRTTPTGFAQAASSPSWHRPAPHTAGPRGVYASNVSEKPPQTYILHTVVLFLVLVTAMVLFLRYKWG